jgi:hypothetical protein
MGRAKTSGPAVALFPFLAVLVCVMGALIFLLLTTTKRMHDTALAEAEADAIAASTAVQPPPTAMDVPETPFALPAAELGTATVPAGLEPAPAMADNSAERAKLEREWNAQIEALQRRWQELSDALQKQRVLQQAAQRKALAVEQSVGAAETRLRGLAAQIEVDAAEKIAAPELAALEERIAELRRKLRQLQNRPTQGATKFAVIPFDVRSGTTRRPILIECTDDGLRFLPEDIVIRPSDLEGFTERYNPLLAGAGALMSYWTAWNLRQPEPDEQPEPYVLLIVRPSGTVGYYVAMQMLGALKVPHGYELIEDSVALQPPPLDPEAWRVCREAVEQQLAERAAVMQQVRNGFRQGKNADGSPDTFQVSDVLPEQNGGPAPGEVGDRSWENMDRFEGRNRRPPGKPAAGGSPNAARSQPPAPRPANPPRELPREEEQDSGEAAPERRPSRLARNPGPANSPASNQRVGQDNPRGRRGGATAGDLHLLARRHWGHSDPGSTIGLEHDVTIRVDAQQMVIADEHVVRCHPGDESLDIFFRVMEAVDAEAKTWGRPRPGFYWTPRLKFVVSPGGNQLFERIDPLVTRSGLSTKREFTLDGVSPAKGETRP